MKKNFSFFFLLTLVSISAMLVSAVALGQSTLPSTQYPTATCEKYITKSFDKSKAKASALCNQVPEECYNIFYYRVGPFQVVNKCRNVDASCFSQCVGEVVQNGVDVEALTQFCRLDQKPVNLEIFATSTPGCKAFVGLSGSCIRAFTQRGKLSLEKAFEACKGVDESCFSGSKTIDSQLMSLATLCKLKNQTLPSEFNGDDSPRESNNKFDLPEKDKKEKPTNNEGDAKGQ